MHGLPLHTEQEKHLPYVNPNAPKGGELKLGVYGSFDNLNRIAFKGSRRLQDLDILMIPYEKSVGRGLYFIWLNCRIC